MVRVLQRLDLQIGPNHVVMLVGMLMDEPCQQFIPIFVIGIVEFGDNGFGDSFN
jgi:hypothetical protein